MATALVTFLIYCFVVALVAGLVYYLVQAAPFLGPPWKAIMLWLVIAIAVAVIILRALPLLGVA